MAEILNLIIFTACLSLGLVFFIFAVVALIRHFLLSKGKFSHALGLGLLQVQLPRAQKKDDDLKRVDELREKIAMMEQVFNQLTGIRLGWLKSWFYGSPYFVLELAVPQVGQEVLFYVAVPRKYVSSAEKLIQGVYADAHIERVNDYTIFHPNGAVATATAKTKNQILPLKSYQTLESDPIGAVLNSFSKVSHQGEGLSIQLVCQRAGAKWNKQLDKIVTHLRQGKNLQKAMSEASEGSFQKAFSERQRVLDNKKNQEQGLNYDTKPGFENLAQLIEKKAGKSLFKTNIRLIASAPDQDRADALLGELATPFNQYTNEGTNSFVFKVQPAGRRRQKVIFQYSFRVPEKSNFFVLSSEELASIFHFPNTVHGATNVAALKSKSAPVPVNLPTSGMLLGLNSYRGADKEVRITEEDRARHFYVIGQTGTGKTYFMRNMIIQDIEAGRGVCFIDPHGDMAEDILGCVPPNRIKDVIYFNPGDVARPMGLNMLEYDPRYPEQKTFIINELLEIFNKLYDMKTAGGPMFEQYFRNATALVMDDPDSGNTLLEINRVFVDKKFRDYKLSKTTNPLVVTFWREVAEKAGGEASLANIVPYISSKFDSFLSNEIMRPVVAQEKSSFRMRDVMDEKKILLVNLSKGRLGELNSYLIGLIMVGKILMAALSRTDIPEKDRTAFYLYADEFQNISTSSIESILSEARKYRLGLVIAHQFIGQLEDEIRDAVFGNVGSMAAFRVGPDDGEFLEKQFAPVFNQHDLINIDNRNCYVRMLIDGQTSLPFNMKTVKGKDSSDEVARTAKEYSRLTYGKDRAVVQEEINAKFRALEEQKAPTKPAF